MALPPPPPLNPNPGQAAPNPVVPPAASPEAAPFPLPSASPPPPLNREELLRQAAQAPANTFILPQPLPIQPIPNSAQAATLKGLEFKSTANPSSVPIPQSGAILSGKVETRAPVLSPPVPPAVNPDLLKNGKAAVHSVSIDISDIAKVGSNHVGGKGILIGILGLLIALGILAGSTYALVLKGVRLPGLYSGISGLDSNGVTLSKEALALIKTHPNYQQSGQITLKSASGSVKPSLPTTSSGTVQINSLQSVVALGAPLQYSLATGSFQGKLSLNVDSSTAVPVYLRSNATTGGDQLWAFDLPANIAEPLVAVPQSAIKNTLVYAVVRPVALTDLLDAVQTSSDYEQISYNGQNAASYTYTLDPKALQASLPEGTTASAVTASVHYLWHTKQPSHITLQATVSYQGRQFIEQQVSDYDFDSSTLPTDNKTGFANLLEAAIVQKMPVLSSADFISHLGIASYDTIPHADSSSAPVITPAPSPTSSPIPSASSLPSSKPSPVTSISPSPLASPTPTPVAQKVVVPTGQTITVVLSSITTIPPLPVSPAPAEAIVRDTQRKKDLADLQTALEGYKSKQGSYPKANGIEQTRSSQTLLSSLVATYITSLPIDPTKDIYWYEYSSNGSTYLLRSVAENSLDATAKKGAQFSYFELTNK